MSKKKVYRALTGLNYVNKNGNEVRREAGDKLEDLPENVVKTESKAKNIEEWEAGHTENVEAPDTNREDVTAVRATRRSGEVTLREVE